MINRQDQGNGIPGFPRTLAFISAADATIPPVSLADNFMQHLSPEGHRMVLFDINREADTNGLLKRDPMKRFEHLFSGPLPFELHTVTNRSAETALLASRERPALSTETITRPIPYSWPRDMYALSHVSLPFPPDDPIYGRLSPEDRSRFSLGALEPRGERNLLSMPVESLMRLRYNPFYDYMEEMIIDWVE